MSISANRLPVASVALIALLGVLSACGGSSETDSAADPAAQASQSAEPTVEPSSAASSPAATKKADKGSPIAVADILKFTGTTTAGEKFDGASLAGTPAVVWFWAPWCPTCRAQMPAVSQLATEYGDSVQFVGVGGLDAAGPIEDFASDAPQLTHLTDSEGSVWRHFEITEQSVYVVLDADGSVVHDGYLSNDDLAKTVESLAG